MLYLLFAVTVWAFAYGLVKQNLTGIDPYLASTLRLVLATAFFLPWFRKDGLRGKVALRLLVIGALEYGLMYCLYLSAMHYLNAYEVALFTLFVPLYINCVQDIYSRKFHPLHWSMALLGLLGALIIKYQTPVWDHLKTGFLLMQGANLLFAWGMVDYRYVRKANPQLKDHRIFAILFIGAALAAALATTFLGNWGDWEKLTLNNWQVLVYLSIVATGLSFFAWNKGCVTVNPGTAAVVSLLKVPMGVTASLLFFGERTDVVRLLIGLVIILTAVGVSEWWALRKAKQLLSTA